MAAGSDLLLDTHIWIWLILGSTKLPPSLRRVIERRPEGLWLSPVSIWEVGLLADSPRLRLEMPSREWVEEALRRVPLRDAALSRQVALQSHDLDMPNRDPADRLLAGTAMAYDLTLVTLDRDLTSLRWLRTRSR